MPVVPLRRVTWVHQSLQGYKSALTLDRVILMRHETQMVFRYDDEWFAGGFRRGRCRFPSWACSR